MISGPINQPQPCKTTRKMKFRNRLIKLREYLLEDAAMLGMGGPPNNWQGLGFKPTNHAGDTGIEHYFVRFQNDASEIWIGCHWAESDKEEWKFYCTTTVFRKMALWYLSRWIFGEWFGLRRKLYYWDLSRRVNYRERRMKK